MDQALVASLALVVFAAFVAGCYIAHCARSDDAWYSHETEFGRRILEEDRKLKETTEQRARRSF